MARYRNMKGMLPKAMMRAIWLQRIICLTKAEFSVLSVPRRKALEIRFTILKIFIGIKDIIL
jgi:hypothetical protein